MCKHLSAIILPLLCLSCASMNTRPTLQQIEKIYIRTIAFESHDMPMAGHHVANKASSVQHASEEFWNLITADEKRHGKEQTLRMIHDLSSQHGVSCLLLLGKSNQYLDDDALFMLTQAHRPTHLFDLMVGYPTTLENIQVARSRGQFAFTPGPMRPID